MNSILFGLYNKEHPLTYYNILPYSKFYKDMQKHNSLHRIYRNIINLAIMYKDTKFYLPTYMDFRVEFTPMYLTYLLKEMT